MKLNWLERLIVTSIIRGAHQRLVETPALRRLSSLPAGGDVLELGCGNGTGLALIQKFFTPASIQALDLDPALLMAARRNSTRRQLKGISYLAGSAARLPYPDHQFDAIFEFGILHHVLEWESALQECARVLKPGGELLFTELSRESWETVWAGWTRPLLDHPYSTMFSLDQFLSKLTATGFEVDEIRVLYSGIFPWFIGRGVLRVHP